MKLTSEEFNAIFTFYDKVRGRTVGGNQEAPQGTPGQNGSPWSLGTAKLWGAAGPCGLFLPLLTPRSVLTV